MSEVARKIERVRDRLREKGGALLLKGVDWFAWATGGGDNSVIFSAETGVAEVYISLTRACVITTEIERERMAKEQLPPEFELISFPWADRLPREEYLKGEKIYSDRPAAGEFALDSSWLELKWRLEDSELARYRLLGREAALAVKEALAAAEPSVTEYEIAGSAARALWRRGIHPLLTLVGGEERLGFRHPVAANTAIGLRAMLVVCGRRKGLYANLSRHVFFREPSNEEKERQLQVAQVEAVAFAATLEKRPLPEIYHRMAEAYRGLGQAGEILRHHQGGVTGYLSREAVALPYRWDLPKPAENMAFAWNPSLPGAKLEDTVLLTSAGLEILTRDEAWPSFSLAGRDRPAYWVR